MDTFFLNLFEYIGVRLSEHELQYFVETLLEPNLFVHSFTHEQYQRLQKSYNTHVRPKCLTNVNHHPFPSTIEERLAFLEQEHQNTRSFVDLLREHRESFDTQLAQLAERLKDR